MVDPVLLCRRHLLGEHNEIHKHRHVFDREWSIDGRVHPVVQIEPSSMKTRHDELAAEMERRGYNHRSPYAQPDLSHLPKWQQEAKVDKEESLAELYRRCPDCNCKQRL